MAQGQFGTPRAYKGTGLSPSPKVKRTKRLGRVLDYSPKARRRRARQEYLDRPITQGPLTGREAVQEARQLAGLKYGSADRMLGREIKGSQGQHRTIDRAYDLYGQKLGAIAAQTQQAYSNFQNAAYQQANQDTAQVQQGAVPGSELSGQVQNAAAVRNAQTVNFGGMLGAQGAAQTAYQNDQRRIGELERIGSHGQEKKYRRELKAKRRDLRTEKGQYRGEVLRQIRDDERKWTLEQVAFELDKYQAEQDARSDKAKLRADRAHDRKMEKKADRAERRAGLPSGFQSWKQYNAYKRKHEGHGHTVIGGTHDEPNKSGGDSDEDRPERSYGPGGNFTRAELKANRDKWESARNLAFQLVKSNRGAKLSVGELATIISGEQGVPIKMARAAAMRAKRGGVKPPLARTVKRRYGVKVKVKKGGSGGGSQGVDVIGDVISNVLG